jgi:hypothetical protein
MQRLRLSPPALLAALGLVSLGGYLIASRLTVGPGFPLDDSWIHQTYARQLGLYGEWAFLPGQPSAGSTAPVWSALLAIGYWLGLAPYLWTYLLGWLCQSGLAILGWRIAREAGSGWALAAGVLLTLEWHLVWAAGSGMETLLMAFLALMGLGLPVLGWRAWFWLGLLAGGAVWVRPDGVTLLGPLLMVCWLESATLAEKGKSSLRLLAGFAAGFFPYLAFNGALAGAIWPNTYFAKQAEYAVLQQDAFALRFLRQAGVQWIGTGILLLPGFVFIIWEALRARRWALVAGGLWWLGFCGLYAWRLPVTYQYGRYVLPALPVFLVWGALGLAQAWQRWSAGGAGRILTRAWVFSAAAVLVSFWLLGARAYARDVAVIETEMAAAARWVAEFTPPQALIAAHDIGAMGYFANRSLLDLAGLISPEVIPFIRDEARLGAYLDARGAAYLVTFPGWYPELSRCAALIYQTDGRFSPQAGGENMAVYRWTGNCLPAER